MTKQRIFLTVDVDSPPTDTETREVIAGLAAGEFEVGEAITVEVGDWGIHGELVSVMVQDPKVDALAIVRLAIDALGVFLSDATSPKVSTAQRISLRDAEIALRRLLPPPRPPVGDDTE